MRTLAVLLVVPLAAGATGSWCARSGSPVGAEHDGLVPLHRTLDGGGAYTVRWGAAAIDVSATRARYSSARSTTR